MPAKQKITPCLWFDDNAEEAIRFYVATFADAKVLEVTRWGKGGPGPEGSLMTARFQLEGQEFLALNGGPRFKFNEAVSLLVRCDSQKEIDALWARLSAGGEPGRCGWLKDKYGLSWQVVPGVLDGMLRDKDPARVQRVVAAMLQMGKFDLKVLQQAFEQR